MGDAHLLYGCCCCGLRFLEGRHGARRRFDYPGIVYHGNILYIIFGAILLLNTLKHSGAITAIRSGFT